MAVTYDMLVQMMQFLDVDGDGSVSKAEFKVPYMKLFPKMTDPEFEETWKKIDLNGDGDLQFEELATYYGYSLSPSAKKAGQTGDMSDEQILEALQMQALLFDETKKKEEQKKKDAADAAAPALEEVQKRLTGEIACVKLGSVSTGETNSEYRTFLEDCDVGDLPKVMAAIERGIHLRIEDDKKQMPLHKLARHGAVLEMRKLLERLDTDDTTRATSRFDINRADKSGKTPAFYAAEYGKVDVLQLLLDRGCDADVENTAGWTILHAAVSANKAQAIHVITKHPRVDAKKLINHADKTGRTALHIASFKAEEEVITALLENGADPLHQDKSGNDSVKLATKTGRRNSRELLELHVEKKTTPAEGA